MTITLNNTYNNTVKSPDVKWVDDGTRIFGEESVRRDNDLRLKQLLKEHNVNYFSIKGDYYQRLIHSMNIIDNFIENAEW